jgi:hypothetical protein
LRHQLHGDSRDNCSPDAAATVKKEHMSNRYPLPIVRPQARMSKSEIEIISRALKAQVHAAKAAINAYAPKLKAEFELQLITKYPSSGDPVWADAMSAATKEYEIQRARVEARCQELGIPERFRPHLTRPCWNSHWSQSAFDFKDLRAEMRRLAAIQIDDMIKSRLVQLEVDSAQIQFELAANGLLTPTAKQFFARLPTIESLIPKLTVSEVEGLLEGRSITTPPLQLDAPAKLLQLPPSDEKAT